ncbi:MAG: glycoside hydrolase family 27 protein [Cyclobacteriaceae bacterium]|nr:glycoside hydrolase family 27 protein [Cyclobacteriaceae bacterium]
MNNTLIFSKYSGCQRAVFSVLFICIMLAAACNPASQTQEATVEAPSLAALAPKPPMGWNSWNSFGIGVTEAQIKAVADYMASNMKAYGWEYVVVDAGWYHPPTFPTSEWNEDPEPPQLMDEYGRLIPDTVKFPSAVGGAGFQPIADYVHSKGLKFGIHIMRGIPWNAAKDKSPILGTAYTADEVAEANNRCEWTSVMHGINMTHPGGMDYYRSIVKLYADWGVDYIKADDMSRPYRVDEVQGLSKALREHPRDIVLSLSPGAAPLMAARDLREHAHLWRISNDFWDSWESLKNMFDLCAIWAPYITENHWPDADMLPLGKLRKNGVGAWEAGLFNATSEEVTDEYSRLSETEQITLMNLWAIFRSPLMMGGYLPENNDFTLSLLINQELLNVNQNSTNNRVIFQDVEQSVWMADSQQTDEQYLAVFNLSDKKQQLSLTFERLDLTGTYIFGELWSGEEQTWEDNFTIALEPHASAMYKLRKK